MPNRDKTGPLGNGPLTGRGFGPCGSGLKRGLGRGLCRYFTWGQSKTDEEKKQSLINYRKALEEELEVVKEQEEELK